MNDDKSQQSAAAGQQDTLIFAVAVALLAIGAVLQAINSCFLLRMIGKLNDKLPPDRQLSTLFGFRPWKVLYRMYGDLYPDDDLHVRVQRLAYVAFTVHLGGVAALLLYTFFR